MSVARDNVEKLRGVAVAASSVKAKAVHWLRETTFPLAADMATLLTSAEKGHIESFRLELLDTFTGTTNVMPVMSQDVKDAIAKTYIDVTSYPV